MFIMWALSLIPSFSILNITCRGNKLIFGEGLLSTLGAQSASYPTSPICLYLERIGDQHKKQRKMLNPVFSLGNMRDLLPTIQPIANELMNVLRSRVEHGM